MRRFFALLTLCLLASAALAVEIVFDPAVDQGGFSGTTPQLFSISKDGVTLDVSNGLIAPYKDVYAYRIYKNQTLTVTSTIGDITAIEITGLAKNDSTWGAGGFVTEIGTYVAPEGEFAAYWMGETAAVTFVATNYQVRATRIVVRVNETGMIPPSIIPAGGVYYRPVTVMMTCAIPDAAIYYTLDDSEPTTASTRYTAPFELSQSTTVKAISSRDGETSSVVTANFEFRPDARIGLGDLYNIYNLPHDDEIELGYDATVIYQGGNGNRYLYALDETGFGLIYGSVGQEYAIGDVIPAGYKGRVTMYKDEPELSAPLSDFQPATRNVTLMPEEITVADVNHEHWAHYVLLRDVYISADATTITDADGNSCEMYNGTFQAVLPGDLSRPHDVYAVVGKFNNYQILPLAFDAYVPVPGFGFGDIHPPYNPNQRFTFTYDATVLLQYGNNLYAKDPTGYALIYGNVGQTYEQGDVVPGGFSCTVSEYNGNVMLVNPRGFNPSKGKGDLIPEQVYLDDLDGLWCHYVKANSVRIIPNNDNPGSTGILIDQYGNSCTYFDPLGILHGAVIDETVYYGVYGIVATSRDHYEIIITEVDGLPYEPIPNVMSLNELYELPRYAKAHFDAPLIAVYQNNEMLYVKDAEGNFGLVYGNVAGSFNNGDIINDAVCSWSPYSRYRIVEPEASTFFPHASGRAVEPEVMPIEEISDEMMHGYMKFEGVRLTKSNAYGNYVMSDGTSEMLINWIGPLPKPKRIVFPYTYSGELTIADVNFLIDLLFNEPVYWNGKYDVTGFVFFNSNGLIINADDISINDDGYDPNSADVNVDGEVNIADVNALIDLIVGYR